MIAVENEMWSQAADPRQGSEHSRELLSQVILATLASWPDSQQRVFVQSHYKGQGALEIAAALALTPDEVNRMLEACGKNLRSALTQFRDCEGFCRGTGRVRRISPAPIK